MEVPQKLSLFPKLHPLVDKHTILQNNRGIRYIRLVKVVVPLQFSPSLELRTNDQRICRGNVGYKAIVAIAIYNEYWVVPVKFSNARIGFYPVFIRFRRIDVTYNDKAYHLLVRRTIV
jgi:hypothetical protein